MTAHPPLETPPSLHEKVERLPLSPGVYLMKDADGVVLYVGKAINLRNRVRSYFAGGDGRAHVPFLMAEVRDLEFSLAANEREALLLEDTLIKKFRPRYNIRLRDDKTYLSIRFDLNHPWPRLELMRRPRQDGARYFGPYSSATAVRQTVELVSRHFPLRTCEDSALKGRTRPCLQYQIKRCLAPCVGLVTPELYQTLTRQVTLLLEGRDQELLDDLRQQMMDAAERMDFEAAAALRDRMKSLELVTARQQVVANAPVDRDILGLHREADDVALTVIPVRQGRMQDNRTFTFSGQFAENAELVASFLLKCYVDDDFIPREILLPLELSDASALEDILKERSGHKVTLLVPQRGDKTRLVELAEQTARAVLAQELDPGKRARKAAEELQKILSLSQPPHSLECFDISNTLGRKAVASRVRFQDGAPFKEGYRRYRIKTLEEAPNDYGMMREVLGRRLRRGLDEGGLPDVLVVDGGKGQLQVAVAVLQELGLASQPVMGFAKPDDVNARSRAPIPVDKIFLPGRKNPIILPAWSPALRLLQALRDESHRFAITYHRSLRGKAALRSRLEDIPGVGHKRATALLQALGSVKRLEAASVEELAEVAHIGRALAEKIHAFLQEQSRDTQARRKALAADQARGDGSLAPLEPSEADDEALGEDEVEDADLALEGDEEDELEEDGLD